MINYLKKQKHITLLSHVDMDGFASQYIIKNFCQRNDISTNLINMQYGDKPVFDENSNDSVLLVTDLHFNEEQYLAYKSIFREVCWIDHHPSKDYEKHQENPYIIIDTSMSATLLTSIFLNTKITSIIQNINAADIFLKINIKNFIEGREYSYLLNKLFEITDIEDQNFIGRLFVRKLFHSSNPYIAMADTLKNYVSHKNLTLTEITTQRMLSDLLNNPLFQESSTLIVNTTNISDVADLWFSQDKRNQLMIGINFNKNSISFRSTNNKAKQLAEQLNGGGHPKAAGAKLNDSLSQQEVLNIILEILKEY